MNLLLLHGAAGIWDEVACLVIPAMVIMGVALAVLREKAPQDSDDDEATEDGGGTEMRDERATTGAVSPCEEGGR